MQKKPPEHELKTKRRQVLTWLSKHYAIDTQSRTTSNSQNGKNVQVKNNSSQQETIRISLHTPYTFSDCRHISSEEVADSILH